MGRVDDRSAGHSATGDRAAAAAGDGSAAHRAPGASSAALWFARAARAVTEEARRLGLGSPGFRSPPGLAGSDRTIRRAKRGAVVSVRLRDRPFEAVLADMVEGVLVANDLRHDEARRTRVLLLQALHDAMPPADPVSRAA